MKDQSIFFGQDSEHKKSNQIHYIQDVQNPNYISQFFRSQKSIKSPKKQKDLKNHPKSYRQYFQSQIQEKQARNKKKMVSKCHNFQKHLVYTIRKSIVPEEFLKGSENFELKEKIWRQFLDSKKKTKTLIYIALGGIPHDTKENIKEIKRHGFQAIYKKNRYHEIQEAQEQIKLIVISKLKSLNIGEEIQKRKIKKKQLFEEYFNQFLLDVINGNFTRRFVVKKQKKSDQSLDLESSDKIYEEQNSESSQQMEEMMEQKE